MQNTSDVLSALLDVAGCNTAAILQSDDGYSVVIGYDELTGEWQYVTSPHVSVAGALAEATGTVAL